VLIRESASANVSSPHCGKVIRYGTLARRSVERLLAGGFGASQSSSRYAPVANPRIMSWNADRMESYRLVPLHISRAFQALESAVVGCPILRRNPQYHHVGPDY